MGPIVPLAAGVGFLLLLLGGNSKSSAAAGDRGLMITDPAAILDAKRKLGLWGATERRIVPAGYPQPADLTSSIDARFMSAVQSFQRWVNETASASGKLRADGILDPSTKDAIDAYALDLDVAPGASETI